MKANAPCAIATAGAVAGAVAGAAAGAVAGAVALSAASLDAWNMHLTFRGRMSLRHEMACIPSHAGRLAEGHAAAVLPPLVLALVLVLLPRGSPLQGNAGAAPPPACEVPTPHLARILVLHLLPHGRVQHSHELLALDRVQLPVEIQQTKLLLQRCPFLHFHLLPNRAKLYIPFPARAHLDIVRTMGRQASPHFCCRIIGHCPRLPRAVVDCTSFRSCAIAHVKDDNVDRHALLPEFSAQCGSFEKRGKVRVM